MRSAGRTHASRRDVVDDGRPRPHGPGRGHGRRPARRRRRHFGGGRAGRGRGEAHEAERRARDDALHDEVREGARPGHAGPADLDERPRARRRGRRDGPPENREQGAARPQDPACRAAVPARRVLRGLAHPRPDH